MASWVVKKELVFEIVLEKFFYYSGTTLVIMMISAIGSSCFKSDLDCDQILHIQWGSLFPASTSVVDGKIGRFIFCLSTDRIWDYLGSILRSSRYSKKLINLILGLHVPLLGFWNFFQRITNCQVCMMSQIFIIR